ncbi:tetratricopeptide repeat protein [Terracidiphilus gabretensis]|uniref:tetratricopeptide repeat protein n=1 Tax=Terracidiphilus gabretensis TaxID=1577687 RepID=UPI00071B0CC0|nr:tetratricopeptide repeat protein [Terracidiphilus gabretensis]
MLNFFYRPSRHLARLILFVGTALSSVIAPAPRAHSQAIANAANPRTRILLVLPFDNGSNQPNLEWIREAAPEILTSRLSSAGFSPLSRTDRHYALDHLGFPQSFHPSRATSIKLAQTLDAESIVAGEYTVSGSTLTASARIVDVSRLRISQPVTASGDIHSLVSVFDTLTWELSRQLDPAFPISEEAFVAAGANLQLDAFEQYVRGISEPDQTERIRHLQAAVKLNPSFPAAWMALGREDFANQQYEQSAEAFAKVTGQSPNAAPDTLEAGFYRGLSLLYTGNYAAAEAAFTDVSRTLPLAPVLNNQGVAVSRQNHDATALFRQSVTADPTTPDYHFNLAVSLRSHGDTNGASAELAQYLKLRPTDSEALALDAALRPPSSTQPATAPVQPLERIVRTFDASAFRQAAVMMDQMQSARFDALAPEQRAQALVLRARDYLSRGLLLESERLFREAASADSRLADAHEGLAEVRERSGDTNGARAEALASIQLKPSAEAYLVLARIDLAAGQYDAAARNANFAIQFAPTSTPAHDLLHQIDLKRNQHK